MDVVFRFAALRPAPPPSPNSPDLDSSSDFESALTQAAVSDQPAANSKAAAQRIVDEAFLASAGQAQHGEQLADLVAYIAQRLAAGETPDAERVTSAVEEALDGSPVDSFAEDARRAADSVVAAYLLPAAPDCAPAQAVVRGYALAEAAAAGVLTVKSIRAIVTGPLLLPSVVERLRPDPAPAAPEPVESAQRLAEQINVLAGRHRDLTTALTELDEHAEDELTLADAGERSELLDLYVSERPDDEQPADQKRPRSRISGVARLSASLRAAARSNVVLSDRAVGALSAGTVDTIRSLDHDPALTPVAQLRSGLQGEQANVGAQLHTLAGAFASRATVRDRDLLRDPSWFRDPVDDPDGTPPVATGAPTTHVDVKPLGVADLVLVRAHLAHYERAEVAAIENVAAHEKLTHTDRQLRSSDTTTSTDDETTDLRAHSQSVADDESQHTAVAAVGPGIGPIAAQGGTSFATSVTDQVSSSLSRRSRRTSSARFLRESEDTAVHAFDSSAATATHAVYQWLDKVYSAQQFGHGSRLLYDVVVPEPAAVLREALARPRSGLPFPVRPARFRLSPTDLTPDNWGYYAAGHHASGVEAPPAPTVVLAEPFGGRAKDPFAGESASVSLVLSETRSSKLPKGYRATRYRVAVQGNGWGAGLVQVLVGAKTLVIHPVQGLFQRSGALDGETEQVPVGVVVDAEDQTFGVSSIGVGVEIICEATSELTAAWQVKAHAAILDASQRRFADYEQAAATRDAIARMFLQNLPDERKVAIVATEMKRATLEVLTGQGFGGFNALAPDAGGFPVPNAAATAALSPYIRFFEQAVEWDRLAYAFYPYFWGGQPSWMAKLLAFEPDRRFADFLSSGAARVVLPIRPGYEAAFQRFLATGITPTTDDLLDAGGALWVSLVDQLRSDSTADELERPLGEPWEFRVPSGLMHARVDGSMPRWALAGGAWSDAADPAF